MIEKKMKRKSPSSVRNVAENVTKKHKQNYIEDCCVCLQSLETNKKFLRCTHSFHDYCIDEWLTHSNKCPICRICVYEEQEEALQRTFYFLHDFLGIAEDDIFVNIIDDDDDEEE